MLHAGYRRDYPPRLVLFCLYVFPRTKIISWTGIGYQTFDPPMSDGFNASRLPRKKTYTVQQLHYILWIQWKKSDLLSHGGTKIPFKNHFIISELTHFEVCFQASIFPRLNGTKIHNRLSYWSISTLFCLIAEINWSNWLLMKR